MSLVELGPEERHDSVAALRPLLWRESEKCEERRVLRLSEQTVGDSRIDPAQLDATQQKQLDALPAVRFLRHARLERVVLSEATTLTNGLPLEGTLEERKRDEPVIECAQPGGQEANMRGSRWLLLGCTLASVVACADVNAPNGNPGHTPGGGITPVLQELQGVVELVDEIGFGLRQFNDQMVPLLCSDSELLMAAVGREVTLRGRFVGSGEFSVSMVIFADDEEEEYARVRSMAKRTSSRTSPPR